MIMGRSAFLLGVILLGARAFPAGAAPDSAAAKALRDSAAAGTRAADSATLAGKDSSLAAADSGTVDSTTLQARLYEYVAHPILQAVTLPVEWVLVPMVRTLIYPAKDPIRYVVSNDVIDRTIRLISFGDKDQVMLYPTLNLAPGTGSYTGLTLRHNSVFGRPTERMVAMGQIYVNGDWKFRGYITAREMLGTGLEGKVSLQLNRVKNTSVNQPGTSAFWYYADSSNVLVASLSHALFLGFGARTNFVLRDNHFGKAPPQEDSLVSDFFPMDSLGRRDPGSRGLEKNWMDRIVSVGISRDTRNNENITLSGSVFSLFGNYHNTTVDHDYYGWEGRWTSYYKLGKERYEITAQEERNAGGLSLRKMLRQVEMRKLKTQLLSRKVLVFHTYAAQSFELPDNRMPTYGLNTLGNDTPLRGYGGARFKDYTVLSVGGEYRFPVVRLLDGVIFNEYGVRGRSWDKIEYLEGLKNSWGFGVNVRRPDIFLFRVHAGFHGLHGIQLTMSVDANY